MNDVASSNLHEIFCANIRARRKELGLTQQQVADLLGVRQPTYAGIESGRSDPGLALVERICEALDFAPDDAISKTAKIS